MEEPKKGKPIDISQLPEGLRALIDVSAQENKQAALAGAAGKPAILLPEHFSSSGKQSAPTHPKTAKEQELDSLITKRQEIIGQLKSKNPTVASARKKIAAMLPSIKGTRASHTMKLAAEAERIEFLIATEADTPKKERDLLKHLRGIKAELAKHKEFDSARKAIEAERNALHTAMNEINSLERQLAETRRKCDAVYAEVLAERKAAYEKRQQGREERQRRRFSELQERVRNEKRKQHDSELEPYMKKHGDTVSMDEIVQIERKAEKKEEDK